MNERAHQQVERLQSDGYKLTPLDIVDLHCLAEDCNKHDADMIAAPRVAWAGDVPIFQNTIQGDVWFNAFALKWWEGASIFAALAWSCAHGRKRRFFEKWEDEKLTRKEIESWYSSLNCTEHELVFAVGFVTGSGSAENDEAEKKTIEGCPYTHIIHDCISAQIGISVDDIKMMPFCDAVDIMTRWARNQCAINGGDTESIKQRLKTCANIKFLQKIKEIRSRDNGEG